MSHTEELSRFVVECRLEDVPAPVLDVARKCILDWIGVTVGAVGDPGVRVVKEIVDDMGGRPQATVIGYGTMTTTLGAALVNGTMAHALDYDDAHSGVRTHPSAPLVAAILPVAESLGLSGRDLMTAFIVGCEVTLRVGYALGKTYYERGWHSTSVLGRLGCAAAVSRLLGLDVEKVSVALGLAATQAGGLRDTFGTMAKPFHSGKAAADGLIAATLAGKGFTGPKRLLDPDAGFARVFSPEYEPAKLVKDIGTYFHTGEVNFKPHAACLAVHPVIDALIGLKERTGVEPSSIERVFVSVAPFNLKLAGNPAPSDGTEAKFSIPMGAALAMTYGRATQRLFTDETADDPRLKALMAKVTAAPDSSFAETEAEVKIVLKDGREESAHVVTPKGDPRNPMTFEDVAQKMRDLVADLLAEDTVADIVDLVRTLPNSGQVAHLVRLCCPTAGEGRVGPSQKEGN